MLIIGLFYILVPLLLICIILFVRYSKFILWLLSILSFGSVIFYLWLTARWEIISLFLRPVFIILFVAACIISYQRIDKETKSLNKLVTIFSAGIYLALLIFMSGLNWFSIKGYLAPQQVVDLASPFKSGKQVVVHGGRSPFTNAHYHVKPQNYALDIVGLNELGMRASSISGGNNLNEYVIYGAPVYSPVEGVVVKVVDQFEDLRPPETDRINIAGNHILIKANEIEILLAHLKRGSIAVSLGDKVTTDTLLGQVGNSGNTSEPHLHIHVEKGGELGKALDGESVPFTINDRFLVRGDVIEVE